MQASAGPGELVDPVEAGVGGLREKPVRSPAFSATFVGTQRAFQTL